jgi:hypothetical protein
MRLDLLKLDSRTFSLTFSILAVKNTFRDVIFDLLSRANEDIAMTAIASEFAKTASSQEWVHFFDVLLGEFRPFFDRFFFFFFFKGPPHVQWSG